MNHIKTAVLACALLFAVVFSFSSLSGSGTPAAEAKTLPAVSGNACTTFCISEGGTFYINLGASTQLTCTNQGGDWFPDSGCCCKCTRPGQCL